MKLQEFITETLIEISNGIREANDIRLATQNVAQNSQRTFFLRPGSESEHGAGIAFDVAVTTKKAGGGKGGAKIHLSVVEAELGGGGVASKESISRIQFTVNVGQWVG